MKTLKSIILVLIFSPVLLVLSLFLLFNYVRKAHCQKRLFYCLNLDLLDKLNKTQFLQIISLVLKQRGYKIFPLPCFYNKEFLLVKKHNIKLLVFTKNTNTQTDETLVNLAHQAKQQHGCCRAVVISNLFFTSEAVKMASKLNVVLLNRTDLANYLSIIQNNNKKLVRV